MGMSDALKVLKTAWVFYYNLQFDSIPIIIIGTEQQNFSSFAELLLQGFPLALAHYPMPVLKLTGEWKLLVTDPAW